MENSYENSPFYRILADTGRVAVLEVFLSNQNYPIGMDDLHKLTGFSKENIQTHLEVLLTANLIEINENEDLYRLNDTEKTRALQDFYFDSHDGTLDDVIKKTSETH